MATLLVALLIGVTCGLRCMTPIAVVSWAARLGWLHIGGTWLGFLSFTATPYVLSVAALGELVADKLPKTPSRKAPPGFIARIVTGALCGCAFGLTADTMIFGGIAGAVGAVAGTLEGYQLRVTLSRAAGRDLPIALLEDAITLGGALLLCRTV